MANLKNIEKKIMKLMNGSYEPSLADCIRIYKEYKINKGEIASVLSEIYSWLAQEPICINYKDGKLYMRCEILNEPELFYAHYIYVNNEKNIVLENYFSREDVSIIDNSVRDLIPHVAKAICDELKCSC